jgi:hypothetical protein
MTCSVCSSVLEQQEGCRVVGSKLSYELLFPEDLEELKTSIKRLKTAIYMTNVIRTGQVSINEAPMQSDSILEIYQANNKFFCPGCFKKHVEKLESLLQDLEEGNSDVAETN